MSTSDLYAVYRTKTKHIAGFPNGHGTAPVIWGYLCVKFLNTESHSWLLNYGAANQPLWDLVKDPKLSKELRLVHAMTFNNAVCLTFL